MTDRRDVHPRELLSAYLDGELADLERAGVEAHVAECSSCRGLLDDFQAMAAIATREEAPPVPADLRSHIRLKIGTGGAAKAPPPRHRIGYYRLGLAAAAGIVLTIGLWATRREHAPPLSSPVTRSAAPDTIVESDRAKVEKEPVAQPAVPANPGDVASLRELGYIGDESQPKRNAAPSAMGRKMMERAARPSETPAPVIVGEVREGERLETRPAIEAGDFAAPSAGSGSASAAAGVAEAGGARQDVAEERKGAARMQANLPEAALRSAAVGRPGQVLLFLYTTYRVSVHQDGTVALSSEGYTCAVRRDGPSVDPDITSLFVLASSAGKVAGVPSPERRGAAVVRLLEPESAAEEAAGEAPGVDLPAGAGIAIEIRLRTLLRDRYLPLMESRCGAVPRIVHSP